MNAFFSDFFKRKIKVFSALILIPLLLYRKSLGFGFSPLDEQWLILDNATFLAKWTSMKAAFTQVTAFVFYRPLFMVSLIADYHIGKLSPFMYHFTNLLLHLASVILVFRFLQQFKVNVKAAFALALVFAVHPVMLHTVAWIPGRNDSLLCVFSLLSFIYLKKYVSEKATAYALLHVLAFIAALFTKESAVVLPFVFAFVYYTQEERSAKSFTWLCAAWVLIGLSWFLLRKNIVTYFPSMESDAGQALKNIVFSFLVFIGKTIFPVQQSVFPTLKNSSLVPGIITVLVFVALWFFATPKDKRIAGLGLFIFFIFLVIPVAFGILKSPGEQYEHRVYTSMAGLLLFVSQLQFKIKENRMGLVLGVLIVILGLRTYFRMDVYKTEAAFLAAGIKESPDYYFFHLKNGELLYKSGDYNNALASLNKAIDINPSRPQSYNDRANVYFTTGKWNEAIRDYSKALGSDSVNAPVLMQRCIAYYNSGDIEKAMTDLVALKKCCQSQVHPDMEKTLTEKWEIEKWDRKIKADPRNALLYTQRATFFMEKRMGKEALADLQKACELEPGNPLYKKYLYQLSSSLPR